MRSFAATRPWIAALILLLTAPAARAVVVTARETAPTTSAPGNDPGWGNLAYLHNSSAVYLGNRWMITAAHVGEGNVRFTDERAFTMVPGSGTGLTNPTGVSGPDLRMFRLVDDPGLPTLAIATSGPTIGDPVLMIGAGFDRDGGLIGWRNVGGPWTRVPLPAANEFGYALSSTKVMQWGTNEVSSATFVGTNNTRGFNTTFDRFGMPFEAQAVSGDSGGGVFREVDGQWLLAGIMISAQNLGNQPANTAVFRDQSFSADLSVYRDQIVALSDRADPAWQNQANYFDVNHSGSVGPLDVLLVINDLKISGTHALVGTPSGADPLIDVNGDGQLTTTDALAVINSLLDGTGNPPTASTSGSLVPEPSTSALALVACATLLAMHVRRKRAKEL